MIRDRNAAVNAYYDSFVEVLRIQKSGTKKVTPAVRRTTSGDYLRPMKSAIQDTKYRIEGTSKIEGYSVGSQTSSRIEITGCENDSGITLIDAKTGKPIKQRTSGLRARKVLAVKGDDGRWRIDRFVSEKYFEPDEWADRPCKANRKRPRS